MDNIFLYFSGLFAIICGAIFENLRYTIKFSTFFNSFLISFAFSLIAFLPSKNESVYILENHFSGFLNIFLFAFIMITTGIYYNKVIAKITEEVTLIQSIAFVYWCLDYQLFQTTNNFFLGLIVIGFIFSFFSVLVVFAQIRLSKTIRFILSIWSSIAIIVLAIDNINQTLSNEISVDFWGLMLFYLKYFLLGICSIYTIQNFVMIVGFLPNKNNGINNIIELKNDHIRRFSNRQSNIYLSSIHALVICIFFLVNYYFEIFTRNIAIWLVFFVIGNLNYFVQIRKIVIPNSNL